MPEILNVDFQITNFEREVLRIDSVSYSSSDRGCNYVKVNITTNVLVTRVTSPVSINPNTENPFSFDYLRGVNVSVKCFSDDGQEVTKNIRTPDVLSSGNVKALVNNSPEGATITASVFPDTGLVLQYSLNNTYWQTSNLFTGLGSGNYTLYVKDQFGCSASKTFLVDEFGIIDPYFFISKSNSIRYAEKIEWGDCSNYKTDENSLSCEADVPLAYTEIQQWQTCDSIPTQFRSNYGDISAVAIKENGDKINLPIQKMTNNMRLKDRRDARKYNIGGGKMGIYFVNGNIYNYDTGMDTGQNYTLNGALPIWAVVGNYVKIVNTWFVIEEIVFDESRNAEAIIIDTPFTGTDTVIQISCLYNRFNYEVYEFNVAMFQFVDENIRVEFYNNHEVYRNLIHHSELLNVKTKQKGTVEIRYKNKTNTDIFYSTGIENKLRIPIKSINGKALDESETYKTDTTAILISAEVHELDEYTFEPVTKEMMRKLVQALSHTDILINGVSYVKNSSIEVEGALEETNLYIVTATMIKGENAFNSVYGIDEDIIDTPIEVPRILKSGDGFMSIDG